MKPEPFKKTPSGFIPLVESPRYERLKNGDEILLTWKKPRNVKFHRYYFKLLQLVFDNQEIFVNIEHMREELTKAAGYYEHYINHKGVDCYKANSIAFDSMDEAEFEIFFDRFFDAVFNVFGIDKEDLKSELELLG